MYLAVTIVHILVCLVLIMVVLLQSGKAADLAGAFGGMGSQTAFGARGAATMLSKATTICAVVFMLTSLTLAIFAMRYRGPGSVLGSAPQQPASQTVPLVPVPAKPQTMPVPIPVLPGGQKPQKIEIIPGGQPQQQQPAKPAPPAKK